MPKEHVEEYLEAIYDIAGKDNLAKTSEIATLLHNAPASVTEVFQRMAKQDLVRYEPHKGASLTTKGLKIALRIKRKHRLLELFLLRALHLPRDKIHDQACKMEHVLNDDTETAICRALGGPTTCPHGSTIPPCNLDVTSCVECLKKNTEAMQNLEKRSQSIFPLTQLQREQKATIAFIRGGKHVIQRLCDLGLTPGTSIYLKRSAPLKGPLEICVRSTNVVIGRGIAEKIFVET